MSFEVGHGGNRVLPEIARCQVRGRRIATEDVLNSLSAEMTFGTGGAVRSASFDQIVTKKMAFASTKLRQSGALYAREP